MRLQYRGKRYGRHLSQGELNQRIRDIFLNLPRVTPEGKIDVLEMTDSGMRLMEVWTHVLEEMCLRHGPYPAGFTRGIFHREPFPNFASKLAKKAAAALAIHGAKAEDVYIKYGEAKHMTALYERGVLRVQPASEFTKGTYNGAVGDDELSLPLSFALSRDDIENIVENPQDMPSGTLERRMDIKLRFGTDFWLYCLTQSMNARLFVDFAKDACVVIRDPGEFGRRLRTAAAPHFADAVATEGRARYVDPLLPATGNIFVPLAKHFRYTYQDEYRFAWMPRLNTESLTHVDLEIGSLKDIADVILL